ncbi:MAG: NUMOD4 motif-containing HNH endonuclease [Selenomonadaceae bacterium]|nr:NUMOD4 motif-containing HNH endonuclease [Selenomonadaceae bacterium]
MKDEQRVAELFDELKAQTTNLQELQIIEEFEKSLEDTKNFPNEIWRNVTDYVGYEGLYQISTYGRFQSLHYGYRRILKWSISEKGYAMVTMCNKSTKKAVPVHVLVAKAFIPNPENKPEVNHKDGNKLNNHVNNLEWVTGKENVRHAWRNGLVKQKNGTENHNAKLKKEDVLYIRQHYKPYHHKFGVAALAREFNVSPQTIFNVITRKTYKNII